ncbi:MAG: hypothetical protein HON78_04680 [Legionellales bacterium]|nr:hypothetical protein [Legionellales bacterium]
MRIIEKIKLTLNNYMDEINAREKRIDIIMPILYWALSAIILTPLLIIAGGAYISLLTPVFASILVPTLTTIIVSYFFIKKTIENKFHATEETLLTKLYEILDTVFFISAFLYSIAAIALCLQLFAPMAIATPIIYAIATLALQASSLKYAFNLQELDPANIKLKNITGDAIRVILASASITMLMLATAVYPAISVSILAASFGFAWVLVQMAKEFISPAKQGKESDYDKNIKFIAKLVGTLALGAIIAATPALYPAITAVTIISGSSLLSLSSEAMLIPTSIITAGALTFIMPHICKAVDELFLIDTTVDLATYTTKNRHYNLLYYTLANTICMAFSIFNFSKLFEDPKAWAQKIYVHLKAVIVRISHLLNLNIIVPFKVNVLGDKNPETKALNEYRGSAELGIHPEKYTYNTDHDEKTRLGFKFKFTGGDEAKEAIISYENSTEQRNDGNSLGDDGNSQTGSNHILFI